VHSRETPQTILSAIDMGEVKRRAQLDAWISHPSVVLVVWPTAGAEIL